MKNFFEKKKNTHLLIGLLSIFVLAQSFVIAKLYIGKDEKTYEVNLVKIKTKKDSLDFFKLKNDLTTVDNTVRTINSFLKSKNASNLSVEALAQDSLSSTVYLSNQSARYSEYLVELEKKLQQVPLGMPVDGYISSNFGVRKNPIPPKKILMASAKPLAVAPTVTEERDSAGNVIKKTPASAKTMASNTANEAPAEKDQMQFHKGLDIATNYGSDVFCTAEGKVIFAGQKGGYGNCVIVSHGNGLATLYGHLSKILVSANQQIKVGEVIAKSGNTGRSTGPHLHYEVHKNNTPVNPRFFLNL